MLSSHLTFLLEAHQPDPKQPLDMGVDDRQEALHRAAIVSFPGYCDVFKLAWLGFECHRVDSRIRKDMTDLVLLSVPVVDQAGFLAALVKAGSKSGGTRTSRDDRDAQSDGSRRPSRRRLQ